MSDRSKVGDQDTGVDAVRGGLSSLPGHVCSSEVTMQVNQRRSNFGKGPHLFKKGNAAVSTMGAGTVLMRYRVPGTTGN